MFLVHGEHAKIQPLDQNAMDSVISELSSAGYRPVLRSMVDGACTVACLPVGAVSLTDLLRGAIPAMRRSVEPPPAGRPPVPRYTTTGWGCHGLQVDLNPSNRRIRTRTSGGVGGRSLVRTTLPPIPIRRREARRVSYD
jgi:hypothetical protein